MEKPQYSTKKNDSNQNQDLFFVKIYFNHKLFASFYSKYLMKDHAGRLDKKTFGIFYYIYKITF